MTKEDYNERLNYFRSLLRLDRKNMEFFEDQITLTTKRINDLKKKAYDEGVKID